MNPVLSIIVVVHNMPRQALNTIYSLSTLCQKNVCESSYEILIMENKSKNNIQPALISDIGKNIRYCLREETSQSPASAINEGIQLSRGDYIGIVIDGARMASPRCIEFALKAFKAKSHALVSIPSYNIGPQQQHLNISGNYNEAVEERLLEKCRWKENPYRLFDISTIGDANQAGFLNPPLESNFYMTNRKNIEAIGGADPRFNLPGGGSLNLHMFRQLGLLADIQYFLLYAEGTFHQYHGGITTSEIPDREEVLEGHRRQLHSFWGGSFHSLRRQPILLGSITSHSLRFLQYSSKRNQIRGRRMSEKNQPLYPDDDQVFKRHE